MENQKTITGIIGVVAILLGFGGSMVFDQDTIDHSYVCETNTNLGVFRGSNSHPTALSGTGRTGYYINEAGVDKRTICPDGGQWVGLKAYANNHGINPETFLYNYINDVTEPQETQQGIKYECFTEPRECVLIE